MPVPERDPTAKRRHIASGSPAFTAVLGVMAALPALSVDISAPTLALIPTALGTTSTMASLTLSLFMAGFAIGQWIGGQHSDRKGRRPVLLIGLTCYTVASVACTVAPSALFLLIARFSQGVGAGACSVLSFTMVQDLFEGEAARTKRSYVTAVFGIVPMLAPAFGSVLSDLAGWRAVHGVLALGGVSLLLIAFGGIAESRRNTSTTLTIAGTRLWKDPVFLRITLANALSYGGIFAYIAGSPIVIISDMHYSSLVFAGVFACTATALTAGALSNGVLSRAGVSAAAALGPALGIATGAGVALAVACLAGETSGIVLVPLLLITMYARGIIAPNLQHLAVERWPEQAGVANAVVGVSQLVSGALTSAVVGVALPDHGASAIAIPMALLAAGAFSVWLRTSP